MTAVEFEAVRPLLKKMSADRIEAAHAALVDGETLQAMGDRFGWSRQSVDDAVRKVWRTLENYNESQRAAADAVAASLPRGWEQVTLIAPRRLIARFLGEIAQASRQPAKKPKDAREPRKTDKRKADNNKPKAQRV
jgi:hypothetical protein